MGFKIFGIGSVQVPDKAGETIDIDGVNTSYAKYICDEHESGNMKIIGALTTTKKIHNEQEATTPREKQCWKIAQAPFIYIEGELVDGHPDAMATESLIKFANNRPDLPLEVGCSIEGMTLKRGSDDKKNPAYKQIKVAISDGWAVTVKPCNPLCKVFPYNTLTKSDHDIGLSQNAIDKILTTPQRTSSINPGPTTRADLDELRSLTSQLANMLDQINPETLQKSLDDWDKGGMSNLKCRQCDHMERLFKTSRKWPNRCPKCGGAFSMNEIWDALNQ